ncbi:hypothetical protein [Paenibacillus marinisediminis]
MKKCEYCGTRATDDVEQCDSCGSKQFENICIKCGKKTFEEICKECEVDSINREQVQVEYEPIEYNTFEYNPIPKPNPNKTNKIIVLIIFILLGAGLMVSIATPNDGIENSSQEAVKENLSDLELLTMKGHPQFYGDYNEAKKFWKGYDKVKVVDTDRKMLNEDALLLVTAPGGVNRIISNITINLSNVENKHDIKLDDVLKLICDYIPYDIMDKYYTFEKSFHEVHKYEKYEAYRYVMKLNDDGKAVNKLGEKYYDPKFAFKIIHRNDDDWIAEINYLSYHVNRDKSNDPASIEVEDWNVDINKYRTVKSSS